MIDQNNVLGIGSDFAGKSAASKANNHKLVQDVEKEIEIFYKRHGRG